MPQEIDPPRAEPPLPISLANILNFKYGISSNSVIPAPSYARTGYDVNLPLNFGNCFSDICFLGFPMDSRLCGNDDDRMFGVVRS